MNMGKIFCRIGQPRSFPNNRHDTRSGKLNERPVPERAGDTQNGGPMPERAGRHLKGQTSARKDMPMPERPDRYPKGRAQCRMNRRQCYALAGSAHAPRKRGHNYQARVLQAVILGESRERKLASLRAHTEAHIARRTIRAQAAAFFPAKPSHPASIFPAGSFDLTNSRNLSCFSFPTDALPADAREITTVPILSSFGAGSVPPVDFPVDFFPEER